MQILMLATDSVSCSVSVSADWSALESAGLFLWLPVNWTADLFACLPALHFVGWSAWHSLSWTASVPGGCFASCCACWSTSRRQLGPWAGPTEAACDWSSGAGSEVAGWVQKNWAAVVSLGGTENGKYHYSQSKGKGCDCGIGTMGSIWTCTTQFVEHDSTIKNNSTQLLNSDLLYFRHRED